MMKTNMLNLTKKFLFWVVLVWCVGCSLWAFLGIKDKPITYLPAWLPFPWSGMTDFVETPNGEVFVVSGVFRHITRYAQDGRFIASYPSLSQYSPLSTRLAGGQDGSIFLQTLDAIYTCSPEMDELATTTLADGKITQNIWGLGLDGQPVLRVDTPMASTPDRIVRPGEVLFGAQTKPRERFECHDGSFLVRTKFGLAKQTAEGMALASYGAPWWLMPFVFPWPAFLAWPVLFLGLLMYGATRTRVRIIRNRTGQERTMLFSGKSREVIIENASSDETHLLFLPNWRTRIALALLFISFIPIPLVPSIMMYSKIQDAYLYLRWIRLFLFFDIVGFFLLGAIVVVFFVLYAILGGEKIAIHPGANRITFLERLVLLKAPVLVEVNFTKNSAEIGRAQVEMTAPLKRWGLTLRESELYINVAGTKVAIAKDYSHEARAKILEFLKQYFPQSRS